MLILLLPGLSLPGLAAEPAARRHLRAVRPQPAALPLLRPVGLRMQRRAAWPRQVTRTTATASTASTTATATTATTTTTTATTTTATATSTSQLCRPPPDRLLILLLPEGRWWVPTLCWTLSYALSISFRFVSHAALVFGPHRDPPLLALGKTYLTYLSTIVSSTAINLGLVAGAGMTHELALLPTAAFSVLWSYVALSYTWASDGKQGGGSSSCSCCSLCATVSDGHGRRWYRAETPWYRGFGSFISGPWYRAVASQPSTEDHTPVRRASVSLSSAAWLAPGVPEWAGLSPAATENIQRAREVQRMTSESSMNSERVSRTTSDSSLRGDIHRTTSDSSLRAESHAESSSQELLSLGEQPAGYHPTEQPDLLHPEPPPDLLEVASPARASRGGAISSVSGDEEAAAPCSPLPVSMPR